MGKLFKNYLYEAALLRTAAIIMLVIYHSFAPYCNGWKPVEGMPFIEYYWWIGKAFYLCMLELFVFISGYVYAFSNQKKNIIFKQLLINKIKRLLIPGIIFSLLYLWLFRDTSQMSLYTIVEILSGVGHMWFLPMLFWVFILFYIMNCYVHRRTFQYLICLSLFILSIIPIPFGLGQACYYLLFFNLGFDTYRHPLRITPPLHYVNYLLPIATLFIFITTTIIRRNYMDFSNCNLIIHALGVEIFLFLRAITAIFGILTLYCLTNLFLKRTKYDLLWLKEFNKYCFGIYIYQQFILQIIYYKIDIHLFCGYYMLPWTGSLIALTFSYLLSYITKKVPIFKDLF